MGDVKHSREPWFRRGDGVVISHRMGHLAQFWTLDTDQHGTQLGNADRAVACVNALAGMEPEKLAVLLAALDGPGDDESAAALLQRAAALLRVEAPALAGRIEARYTAILYARAALRGGGQ